MAYEKQGFQDNLTVLNAQMMEKIEDGIINTEKNRINNEINPNLNLVVFGDSLFGKPDGIQFIKNLGCNSRNYAVSGATVSTNKKTNNFQVQWEHFVNYMTSENNDILNSSSYGGYSLSRLNGETDFKNNDIDVFLIDGGGNDWLQKAPLGDLLNRNGPYLSFNTNNKLPKDTEESKDLTELLATFCGSLEVLMYNISQNYPKAKKFFLKMHRVYQVVPTPESTSAIRATQYWPATKTEEGGYTFNDLYEKVELLCKYYGFEIIDLYNDSFLNGTGTLTSLKEQNKCCVVKKDPDTYEVYRVLKREGEPKKIITGKSVYNSSFFKKQQNDILNWNSALFDYKITIEGTEYPCTVDTYFNNIDLFDWKGIHPTPLGYELGYMPHVKKALLTCKKVKIEDSYMNKYPSFKDGYYNKE